MKKILLASLIVVGFILLMLGCSKVDERGFNSSLIHNVTRTKYDENGYDFYSFDENGFDKNGFDAQGCDIKGFNRTGIHKITKTKYDENGYDCNGNKRVLDISEISNYDIKKAVRSFCYPVTCSNWSIGNAKDAEGEPNYAVQVFCDCESSNLPDYVLKAHFFVLISKSTLKPVKVIDVNE